MKKKAKKKWNQFPNEFSIHDVKKAKTIYDFDNSFTAPIHGFLDVEDYWQKASSSGFIHKIKIRTLLINAKNDPIVPFSSLPHGSISENPLIETWFPESGGHVCFVHSSDQSLFRANYCFFPKAVLTWCKNF